MTYCLGVLLTGGLVMASDSRSHAGIDHITQVSKMTVISQPGERVIVILTAGNLSTSQSVVTHFREAAGSGEAGQDLLGFETMFEVAGAVGERLRTVMDREAEHVRPYADPTASFLVGGQMAGEPPRLFEVYAAGNFIEATEGSFFLQIGETKYGKPILDRALTRKSPLDQAAKLALLSFDATIRSNLSVGLPIELLRYEADSFSAANREVYDEESPYWIELRRAYSRGLISLVRRLPPPPNSAGGPLRPR